MNDWLPCGYPVTRRALLNTAAAAALLSSGACSMLRPGQPAQGDKLALARLLAPTGRLRASINLGNPILATRRADGVVTGVSVDMSRSLAERLGVDVDLMVVESAGQSVEVVKSGRADIGYFAIDPLRSQGIRFTSPYVLIEGAYLVRQDSQITDNSQVDRTGVRVMVGKLSAYDLYLSRELKVAQIERSPTSPTVVDTFLAQKADVAAGVKQQLQADAARLGGLRLLPGRFMVIEQAMGLPEDRGAEAARALNEFVAAAKTGGFVSQALDRNGIKGAIVPP